MPLYSLFYYQKASSLRPYDTRMWSALGNFLIFFFFFFLHHFTFFSSTGNCYDGLERTDDAILCFERFHFFIFIFLPLLVFNFFLRSSFFFLKKKQKQKRAIDKDGNGYLVLAKLYKKKREIENAAYYYDLFVKVKESYGVSFLFFFSSFFLQQLLI